MRIDYHDIQLNDGVLEYWNAGLKVLKLQITTPLLQQITLPIKITKEKNIIL
jgi:hypothetical protein